MNVTHGRVERLKNEIDCLEREIKAAKDERQQLEKQKSKEVQEMDELKEEILFLKDEIQSGQVNWKCWEQKMLNRLEIVMQDSSIIYSRNSTPVL